MPAVANSKVKLDSANGTRGSTFFSVTPRYGAIAPPAASPHNISAFICGTLGAAEYLDNNTHGGARNAEEVTIQTNVKPNITTGAKPLPKPTANGSSRKATHDTTVMPMINGATRPITRCARSAATPT